MPRIVKDLKEEQSVQLYDFFAGFKIDPSSMEEEAEEEPEEAEDENETAFAAARETFLAEAKEKAERLIHDAREQAEILREKGYREGLEAGREDGTREAYEEHRQKLSEQRQAFQNNAAELFESVGVEKDRLLEKYIDDLKRVSLAVAEKIIQTSLQSSGDIIKRMILAATEKMTRKRWAKIYITKNSTSVSLEADAEFLEALSNLSDNVKIVAMDGEEDGTCIIETPDEIVDASVSTQLENIQDILNNVRHDV